MIGWLAAPAPYWLAIVLFSLWGLANLWLVYEVLTGWPNKPVSKPKFACWACFECGLTTPDINASACPRCQSLHGAKIREL